MLTVWLLHFQVLEAHMSYLLFHSQVVYTPQLKLEAMNVGTA